MTRSVLWLIVASSLVGAALPSAPAQRPRYGGTLRVQMQAAIFSLDPAHAQGSEAGDVIKLNDLMYDHVVTLDSTGHPRPSLALSWQHNRANTHWQFKIRPGVKWHDGGEVTPAEIGDCVQKAVVTGRFQVKGDTFDVDLDESRPDFLIYLATAPNTAIRRTSTIAGANPSPGTGPFRVVEWRPGTRVVFQANEDYWGGRPYLDNIDVAMGRSSRDELTALQEDRADVVEFDPGEARRAQQEGQKIWVSSPVEQLAIQFDTTRPKLRDSRIRESVALSIDRGAIQRVILQNYGETSASLLPQWLSGYSFLFSGAADLDRARKLISEVPKPVSLKVAYDFSDPVARQVAERVIVNVRDLGVVMEAAPPREAAAPMDADLRLVRRRLTVPSYEEAVRQAGEIGLSVPAEAKHSAEDVYKVEEQFLSEHTLLPLVYVPDLFGIGPRVKAWPVTYWGEWRLEDVWLETSR
jgi:peptide/nickel transport system substrate-binding protein